METNEKAFDTLVYLSSLIANSMDKARLKEMLARDIDLSDIEVDMTELSGHIDMAELASQLDMYDLANYHLDLDDLASHVEIDHETVAGNIDMNELSAYLGAEGKEKLAELELRFDSLCKDVEGAASFKKDHEQMMEQIALEHERMQAEIIGLQDLTCDLNLALDRIQKRSFGERMRRLWRWIRKTCRL